MSQPTSFFSLGALSPITILPVALSTTLTPPPPRTNSPGVVWTITPRLANTRSILAACLSMQRSEQYTEGGVATLLQSGPVQDVDLVSCFTFNF